jgi:hypothetical protein
MSPFMRKLCFPVGDLELALDEALVEMTDDEIVDEDRRRGLVPPAATDFRDANRTARSGARRRPSSTSASPSAA